MAKINKKDLDAAMETYSGQFDNILNEYEKQAQTANKYLNIIDEQIETLVKFGATQRGVQQHLAEHMTNAVSLISHCQSITDSKFKLKKQMLDYAIKDLSGDEGGNNAADMTKLVGKLIQAQEKASEKLQNDIKNIKLDTNIDDEITRILSNTKE